MSLHSSNSLVGRTVFVLSECLLKFVGKEKEPTPLRDDEVRRLLGQADPTEEAPMREEIPFLIGQVVEITEGLLMNTNPAISERLLRFRDAGIQMAIDDFGTGYSSLSYLKRFHVYKLKIDQSFVRDITDDPEDRGIVVAIIQLAKSLGFLTIAEGVETVAALEELQRLGCCFAQGYLFSPALALPDFIAWCKANPNASEAAGAERYHDPVCLALAG